ncbi:hypothetical protein [Natronorubrum thiooxidans]|uniref:Uncharacterized protein n=1 Tax=Natronorubrum thiooxidans TaxID=308853 RepID=A0A1N7G163_9EURY|nr:hypothetical protein [Natronorubrum thiooxidans]SIS06343.1 hypothetical protein SAMN05421752_109104 [Natronorubrum thiooxidans]
MARALVRSLVLWSLFAFLAIASFDALIFGRFEPTRYLPGAIGAGIGIAAADQLTPIRVFRF